MQSIVEELKATGVRDDPIIYLELLRREGSVYIGQGSSGEIDFVTQGPSGRACYQVCESVVGPKTRERTVP